jgi:hypothetical protein
MINYTNGLFFVLLLILSGCGTGVNPSRGVASLYMKPSTLGVGGSVDLAPMGGTGNYTYSSSNGGVINGSIFTATEAGTATVTVNDGLNTFTTVFFIKGATALTASGDSTCVKLSSGEVQCFGYDPDQVLAGGVDSDSGHDLPATSIIDNNIFLGITTMIKSPGNNPTPWSCVSGMDESVYCWGKNTFGGLGNGTTTDSTSTIVHPVDVNGYLVDAFKLVMGTNHVCAINFGGRVWCWGNNDYGQIGAATTAANCNGGSSTCALSPIEIFGGSVLDIAAGGNTTCASFESGAVQCWGNNSEGQGGTGSTTPSTLTSPTSTLITTGAIYVSLAGNGEGACATVSGGLKCWGGVGQPGSDSLATALGNTATPTYLSGVGASTHVTAVTSMNQDFCVIQDGGVKCLGENSKGECGGGSLAPVTSFTSVSGLTSGVEEISGGSSHVCSLKFDSTLYCWGRGSEGQLGQGSERDSSRPLLVSQWE